MAGPVNPREGFKYNAPTAYTDGTPMPATAVEKYQIGIGTVSGTYPIIVDDVQMESGSLQLSPISLIGTLTYGQKYAAVRVVSKEGKVSAWSAEAAFVLEAATPNAPSNFSVA